ncbi:sensor histidine kinase [Streptomyces sp. RPT161]|uniref:sensor histidine kinase n=1 Tax=Streptomyces sp. RPT161 TaxID=3015993 RepID=UPI0022B8A65E|nr:ATP-binding protein [Streptomyces sp. RPT161]
MQLRRALRKQAVLRLVIVASLVVELIVFPPRQHAVLSLMIATAYAAWSLALMGAAWSEKLPLPAVCVPMIDLLALGALLAASGVFSDPQWASPLVDDAFLMIPILAAFQLRPRATAMVSVAAALAYVVGVGIGHRGDDPYWNSTLVHALFIAVVGAGCVLLTRIQQSRVRTIGTLLQHRSWLLSRVMSAEERERSDLAEIIHDGALQNVLAARQDVEEAAAANPNEALDRAARALREATRQLRCSVTALHPEVLEHAGLAQALRGLARQLAHRTRIKVHIDGAVPSTSSADRLLYRVARELLGNAVKHARAQHVSLRLTSPDPRWIRLEIADDGIGMSPGVLDDQLSAGHIGLASHRTRVEGAGGRFTLRPNAPHGTVFEVLVPVEPASAP